MFSPQARNLPCQKLTGFYNAEALASNFVPFTVHCIMSNFRELNLTIYVSHQGGLSNYSEKYQSKFQ